MDNYRFAENIPYTEPSGQEYGKGLPPVAQQGRQISRVLWVRAIMGIVMASGIREGIGLIPFTTASLMDVEGKNRTPAWPFRHWQPGYLGCCQHPLISLVKAYRAADIRVFTAALDHGECCRPLSEVQNIMYSVHADSPRAILFCTVGKGALTM